MTDLADSNLNNLKYIVEVTPGTTPTGPLVKFRNTGNTLNGSATTTESDEIRSDRATADLVPTNAQSAGDVNIEWSYTEYEPFIESALGGALSTVVSIAATDISAASADNSYNSAGSGFGSDISAGHWLRVAGFTTAANNGLVRVVSATTSKIVVERATLVTEIAGDSVTIKGRSVRNGTTTKSFSIEEEQTDIANIFTSYVNMIVNTMNINAASGSKLDGSFGFMGTIATLDGTTTIGDGSGGDADGEVASSANSIMSASQNVGDVWLDGALACTTGTYFKSINLSTTNNLRIKDGVCSLYAVDVGLGTLSAELALNVYFSNTDLLTKHLNNTALSFSYAFTDVDGNSIVVDIPRGKLSNSTDEGKSKDSDRMISSTLKALYDPTDGYSIQISVIPA